VNCLLDFCFSENDLTKWNRAKAKTSDAKNSYHKMKGTSKIIFGRQVLILDSTDVLW
jgi:hypothetical protein